MIAGSPVTIQSIPSVPLSAEPENGFAGNAGAGASFATMLASMTDTAAGAVGAADRSAAMLAGGRGDVAATAIARAKADIALEIASVAASRVSSAITSLLQTQS
jgi:flagellar hook-basal body complex protein FliE